MKADYDEDVLRNGFLRALTQQHRPLLDTALSQHALVCVPQQSVVAGLAVIGERTIRQHILLRRANNYTNLCDQCVQCVDGRLQLLHPGHLYAPANILFEETVCGPGASEQQALNVCCIDALLTTECSSDDNNNNTQHANDDNASSSTSTTGQQPMVAADRRRVLASNQLHYKCLFGTQHGDADALYNRLHALRHDCAAQLARQPHATLVWLRIVVDKCVKAMLTCAGKYRRGLGAHQMLLAVQWFLFEYIGDGVLSAIRAVLCEKEGNLNAIRVKYNQQLRPHSLNIHPQLLDNIYEARFCLNSLAVFSNPFDRLVCLRETLDRLAAYDKSDVTKAKGASFTADDLLPAVAYLVISSNIHDWYSNLHLLDNFNFSSSKGDDLAFSVASFEAAVEYLGQSPFDDILQRLQLQPHHTLASSEPNNTNVSEYLLSLVVAGDDVLIAELFQQQAAQQLACSQQQQPQQQQQQQHDPLCSCTRCGARARTDSTASSSVGQTFDVNMSVAAAGRTAIHVAALLGKTMVLNVLVKFGAALNEPDDAGCTPLHLAAQSGSQSATLLLLHLGANNTSANLQLQTPLHLAVLYNHVECVKALLYFDEQVGRGHIDVDCIDQHGNTPIHLALLHHYVSIVPVLLERQVSLTVRNKQGATPLDYCHNNALRALVAKHQQQQGTSRVSFRRLSSLPVPELGLSDGQQSLLNQQSVVGAMEQQRRSDRLIKCIRDNDVPMLEHLLGERLADADADVCHPLCQCHKCIDVVKERGVIADMTAAGSVGVSAVQYAAQAGKHKSLRLLLARLPAAHIRHTDGQARNLLHLAIAEQHKNTYKCVQQLCAAAPELLAGRDAAGNTPLLLAVLHAASDVFQLLLTQYVEQRPDQLSAVNDSGDNVLHAAVAEHNLAAARLVCRLLPRPTLLQLLAATNAAGATPAQCAQDAAIERVLAEAASDNQSSNRVARSLEVTVLEGEDTERGTGASNGASGMSPSTATLGSPKSIEQLLKQAALDTVT